MKKMVKAVRSIAAVGLAGIMMAGTAYAGTWEVNTFSPIMPLDGYTNGQESYKTYSGFADDRSQATLIGTDWKYQKDDGSYAASEWVEDETGKYYINASGRTYKGYCGEGTIDAGVHFFEPFDGHLVTDSIVEAEYVGGWDIQYTLNEDGTWDFVPWDGFELSDYQNHCFWYFDENGVRVADGNVPGGIAAESNVQNVEKGVDENGVPYLTVGDVRYVAVKCSSIDQTYEEDMGFGTMVKSGDHEFYTVYARQK